MNLTVIIPSVLGILGVAGLIFTALRFRRDDTTAVVTQQSQILGNMRDLNEELRHSAAGLRDERDSLRGEVAKLRGQVDDLTVELRVANAALSGQVSRIQDTLDEGSNRWPAPLHRHARRTNGGPLRRVRAGGGDVC